jgi:hypothetical protein
MIDIAFIGYSLYRSGKKKTWTKRLDAPLGVGLDFLLGATSLVLGATESGANRASAPQVLSNILSPWPALFQLLRAFKNEWLLLIKLLVADGIGGFGGTVLRLSFNADLHHDPDPAVA